MATFFIVRVTTPNPKERKSYDECIAKVKPIE